MRIKKIGLVLSGGDSCGIVHLGVLKALEELDVRPDIISSTSSGAIISAFYAAGYSLKEITDIITGNNFFHSSDIAWNSLRILKKNESMYQKYFKNQTFQDLQIPLHISATDIINGTSKIYSSGDLINAVIASSTIPVLFESVKFNDKLLIDRESTNYFPTEPLINNCDTIIGVYVKPTKKTTIFSSMANIFEKSFYSNLILNENMNEKKRFCDLLIEPQFLIKNDEFDRKRANDLIDLGYNYTLGLKERIAELKS